LENKKNDRIKWNQENFEALKKTLNQFIPLIQFVEIPFADFFDKVYPYKAIIPKHIYEKIKEFYYKSTLSKTTTIASHVAIINPISTIIKSKLVTIIANWINRNDSAIRSINNNFTEILQITTISN